MKLSEKLKILRIENNLAQEDLEQKLYVYRQAIFKWEKEVTLPRLISL